jgi:hypothetical protein
MNNRKINNESKKNQEILNIFINLKLKEFKMKTTKVTSGVLSILLISVIIGCSDNFIAPTNSSDSEYSQKKEIYQTGESFNSRDILYTFSLKIQPNEFRFFESGDTQLEGIRSFSISNCSDDRIGIKTSSSSLDQIGNLGCSWSSGTEFILNDLLIENTGSQVRVLEVAFYGPSLK